MKVFFVGEGPHDVGRNHQQDCFVAGGVVPTLARRTVASISEDSLAMFWHRIPRFPPKGKESQNGLTAKAKAAILIARLRHQCDAAVLVVDNDGRDTEKRLEQLSKAKLGASIPVVCGLAIESVEAWSLGATDALAEELGVSEAEIQNIYPLDRVERFKESSEREEHRPKCLMERVAQLGHRCDSVELREEVAKRTNIEALARVCPNGFGPFAKELDALQHESRSSGWEGSPARG